MNEKSAYSLYMASDFDRQKYISLLQKINSNLPLTAEETKEYYIFGSIIESQMFFNNSRNYLELIKDYKLNQINCLQFEIRFNNLYKKDMEKTDSLERDLEALSKFEISSKSNKFGNIIATLFNLCELLSDDLSESEFEDSLDELYKRIQEYTANFDS